jgi:hypothetical protein
MEEVTSALPGYKEYEYLLVLQPHEELWNRIMNLKKEFAEKFDAPGASWTKPNITIAKFTSMK